MVFEKTYLTLSWPNFSQIGSRVADLKFKTYPQLALIFIWRKQGKKIFGCVLPVTRLQQVITPNLSMLMHTRKGTTIVTQQEKVTKETRRQINNLFQRLCSVRSLCCRESIFSYLRRAVFILSQANFYSIHFLKVRHFPGKIDNKPLPGVFLEAALPLQQTFKKVLRPIFIWRGTCREFVARLAASQPKKLAPLAKKLVKFDFDFPGIFF